jgi:hypothetical protein
MIRNRLEVLYIYIDFSKENKYLQLQRQIKDFKQGLVGVTQNSSFIGRF